MRFCDLVGELTACLAGGRIHFGHGMAGARDEARAIANHVCGSGKWQRRALLERRTSAIERARARRIARMRVSRRLPLAYLIREAWFSGMRFDVDKRVCIPRSPLAELIGAGFAPWRPSAQAPRVIDLCTGSGCIAAACAFAFPGSEVVATDISGAALSVARRNMRRLGLTRRVELRRGSLFAGAQGRFDLIIANPPYVPAASHASLPLEYRHEPAGALTDGADGLAIASRILAEAPRYLAEHGLLALEVGEVAPELAAAHPSLPFLWPSLEKGGDGVLLLRAGDFSA